MGFRSDPDPPSEREHISSEDVATRAARGDASALGLLYERHNDFVVKVALRVLRHAEDAEDVAQVVWSTLQRRLENSPHRAKFTTWLYSVVTHAAIDQLRKRKRSREVLLGPPDEGEVQTELEIPADASAGAPDPELDFYRRRFMEELRTAIDDLRGKSEVRAVCFEKYYVGELSVKEIAAETGLSEGTVKSHLFYARKYILERYPLLSDLRQALSERVGGL